MTDRVSVAGLLKITALIGAFTFLQVSVLPSIWLYSVKPDLLLVLAILISLNYNFTNLIVFVLLCGISKDIFSLSLPGFNAFAFSLEAGIVFFIFRRIYKEIPWLELILVASATMLNYLALTLILGKPYILIGIQEAALNCLFLPLVLRLFNFIRGRAYEKNA